MKAADSYQKLVEAAAPGRESKARQGAGPGGVATCAIAAGAQDAMDTVREALKAAARREVDVIRVGCVGRCAWNRWWRSAASWSPPRMYVQVTTEMAREIVKRDVLGESRSPNGSSVGGEEAPAHRRPMSPRSSIASPGTGTTWTSSAANCASPCAMWAGSTLR